MERTWLCRNDRAEASMTISSPMRPTSSRSSVRRGEFAFKGDFDYMKDKLGMLASFAATLLLLFIASGVVRNSVLARNEAKVDAVLCKTTERILGKCETNYDKALNLLQGVESPAAALPKMTAVNLLAEVTQRISRTGERASGEEDQER